MNPKVEWNEDEASWIPNDVKRILLDKSWSLRFQISSYPFLDRMSGALVNAFHLSHAATRFSLHVEVFLFTILERRIYEHTHEREVHGMPPRFPAGN